MTFSGQTVLHKLVLEESTEDPLGDLVILLLHGVAVDMFDSNGDTALHCMARLPAKQGVSFKNLHTLT